MLWTLFADAGGLLFLVSVVCKWTTHWQIKRLTGCLFFKIYFNCHDMKKFMLFILLITLIFNWESFYNTTNIALSYCALKANWESVSFSDSLLIFIQDGDKENINSINAISTLASKVFIIMLSYDKIIFDLKSASYLYQLILSLHVISGQEFHKQQSKQMRELY